MNESPDTPERERTEATAPLDAVDATCGECAFYDPSKPLRHNGGLCRRNPPVPGTNHWHSHQGFPLVDVDDWCGEWRPVCHWSSPIYWHKPESP
jgi:hypothetical protein